MGLFDSRVILCETSSREGNHCLVIDPVPPRPGCDPRCGQHPQPENYIQAAEWADEMLEGHDQRRCPGCDRFTVWVPHVAADDLGRGSAT